MSGTDDEPILIAGEYVLGLLDPVTMRQVESQAATDPGLAADIVFWEDQLAPIARLVLPVPPPAVLWSRLALAAGIPQPRRDGSARLWQGTTAAALAIAACFAYLAFLPHPPEPEPPGAQFAAVLAPPNAVVPFLALARPDGSIAITRLSGGAAPAGRDLQLWSLPRGATRPVSLGVLSAAQSVLRPAARPQADEQLLVSNEPAGGSPTGQPTGAVLFGGTLTPLNPAPAPGR